MKEMNDSNYYSKLNQNEHFVILMTKMNIGLLYRDQKCKQTGTDLWTKMNNFMFKN